MVNRRTGREREKGTKREQTHRSEEWVTRVGVNSGGRLPALHPERFTPDQKRLAYEISTYYDGKVDGPYAIWIRVPEIAEKASGLNTVIRTYGKLERRLFELIVLIVAHHYKAQFEWCVHEPSALKAGVPPTAVEAIRVGDIPEFARRDERVVYDVVTEINERGTLSQKSYDRALAEFGQKHLIELVTAVGLYTMVAILLNVFDAPVPGGQKPRLS